MDSWKNRLVAAFPHLNELSEAEREAQLGAMSVGTYEPGTVMLEQGRRCRGVALVLSGVIRVYQMSADGREITLYRVYEGETCVLAIACLLGGVDYPVIAVVEDEAEVVMMPTDLLRTLMQKSEPWQRYLFSSMASSMVSVMKLLDEVAFRRMDSRLALRLLQCERNQILFTHEELAADIGTAREVVSRLLKEFEGQGIVSLRRGAVHVTDRARLEEIAEM